MKGGQRSPGPSFRKWYNQLSNPVCLIWASSNQWQSWRQYWCFQSQQGQRGASYFMKCMGGKINVWFFYNCASLPFPQSHHMSHVLSSRHLGLLSSEATFLSSYLFHHIPYFNLFSPPIFHSLPAFQYLFISPALALFPLLAAADCHLCVMSRVEKSLPLSPRPFLFIITSLSCVLLLFENYIRKVKQRLLHVSLLLFLCCARLLWGLNIFFK